MIKVDKIEVWGWEHTVRGVRNPMNSWNKSDSKWDSNQFTLGEADLDLMQRLFKASLDNNFAHRKFMRQIMVSMDITAPLYYYKEFDTYKVGTVANSTSTMHKVHSKEFVLDDFSHEHLLPSSICDLEDTIRELNRWRNVYLNGGESDGQAFEPKSKEIWWQLIQLLPSTYNQTRTVTLNYEVAVTMIKQRTGHKLDEWREFVGVLKDLPYLRDITGIE